MTGALELISVDSNGVAGDDYSYLPSLTPDLRYIAFSSWSTNLVAGDTNGPYPDGHDIFVRDRQSGTTERVSVGPLGVQGDDQSYYPSISARSASLGDPIQPGQSRGYFVAYRDPAAISGCSASATFNATQTGLVVRLP